MVIFGISLPKDGVIMSILHKFNKGTYDEKLTDVLVKAKISEHTDIVNFCTHATEVDDKYVTFIGHVVPPLN